jgi:hypothetical protein
MITLEDACRGPASRREVEKEMIQISSVDEAEDVEQDAEVEVEMDLVGGTAAAADAQARNLKRLDVRRSRPKKDTSRRTLLKDKNTMNDRNEVVRIERIACGSGDPFETLPEVAHGETRLLSHHCMFSILVFVGRR